MQSSGIEPVDELDELLVEPPAPPIPEEVDEVEVELVEDEDVDAPEDDDEVDDEDDDVLLVEPPAPPRPSTKTSKSLKQPNATSGVPTSAAKKRRLTRS